jgi:hypothetical protein
MVLAYGKCFVDISWRPVMSAYFITDYIGDISIFSKKLIVSRYRKANTVSQLQELMNGIEFSLTLFISA